MRAYVIGAILVGLIMGFAFSPSQALEPSYGGDTTYIGDVGVTGDVDVTGDITASGDIDATGDMSADEVTANTHTGGIFNGTYFGDGTNISNIPGSGTNLNLYFTNTPNGLVPYRQMTTDSSVLSADMIVLTNTVAGDYSVLYNGISDTGVPGITVMPGGVYSIHVHALTSSTPKTVEMYSQFLIYNGTGEELIATSETVTLTTVMTSYDMSMIVPDTVIEATDRYVVHIFSQVSGSGATPDVEVHVEGSSISRLEAAGPNLSVDTFMPYTGAIKNVISTHGVQADNLAVTSYEVGTIANDVTIDFSNGGFQQFTLTNTVANLLAFTNVVDGGMYTLLVQQPSIANGTIVWPANVKWEDGSAPTLTNYNASIDIIMLLYNGTNFYGTAVNDMK
jgi:hypothetical protein